MLPLWILMLAVCEIWSYECWSLKNIKCHHQMTDHIFHQRLKSYESQFKEDSLTCVVCFIAGLWESAEKITSASPNLPNPATHIPVAKSALAQIQVQEFYQETLEHTADAVSWGTKLKELSRSESNSGGRAVKANLKEDGHWFRSMGSWPKTSTIPLPSWMLSGPLSSNSDGNTRNTLHHFSSFLMLSFFLHVKPVKCWSPIYSIPQFKEQENSNYTAEKRKHENSKFHCT